MKTNKMIVGALAAIFVTFGANAASNSMKGIEKSVAKSVDKLEKLTKELDKLRENENIGKYEKANESAENCAEYDDTFYVKVNDKMKCVTENPCTTNNESIKGSCDNTFKDVYVDGVDVAETFIRIKSGGEECAGGEINKEYVKKYVKIVRGQYGKDTVYCKSSGKVYLFKSLNATNFKDGADGHVLGWCIAMGGTPDESGEISKDGGKNAKWFKCKVDDADLCKNNLYGVDYPGELSKRDPRYEKKTETCDIKM
jgi:hypothetical protein